MLDRILTLMRLMTVETAHVRPAVLTPLELMHDGGGLLAIALGAAAGRMNGIWSHRPDLDGRTGLVDQDGREQERTAYRDGDKD